MTKQKAARGLVMLAISSLAVAPGMAAFAVDSNSDVTVSAAIVDTTGASYRTLTAANVSLALANTATTPVLTGVMAPSVSELLMSGSNPWSVKVKLANDFTRATGTETLDGTNLTLTPGTHLKVQTDTNVSFEATTAGNLDSAGTGVTLMKVIGQTTTAQYTGSYTANGSLSLAVPSGQVAGTYTATMTVTLTY